MTKGFIFSEPQRKRESLKSWVHHFVSLGLEIHLLKVTDDGKILPVARGRAGAIGAVRHHRRTP